MKDGTPRRAAAPSLPVMTAGLLLMVVALVLNVTEAAAPLGGFVALAGAVVTALALLRPARENP